MCASTPLKSGWLTISILQKPARWGHNARDFQSHCEEATIANRHRERQTGETSHTPAARSRLRSSQREAREAL